MMQCALVCVCQQEFATKQSLKAYIALIHLNIHIFPQGIQIKTSPISSGQEIF